MSIKLNCAPVAPVSTKLCPRKVYSKNVLLTAYGCRRTRPRQRPSASRGYAPLACFGSATPHF